MDALMAAGVPRELALDRARRLAFSDYQRHRYRTDKKFRERQKQAARQSYELRRRPK